MRTSTARALLFVTTGLVATVTVTTAAHAEDPAAAQALFAEGRDLVRDGKYAEACPKFEESERLDPGTGTLFNLADCEEHVGKLATAWAHFLEVASRSRSAGQGPRERVARERAAALQPQIPRLVIAVPPADYNIQVQRDGIGIGRGQWGSPLPMDPGEHIVQATADGHKPWSTKVTLQAGQQSKVDIPPLEVAPADPTAAGGPNGATLPDGPTSGGGSIQKTGGIVLLAAGGAALIGAGVLGLFALNKHQQSEEGDHCVKGECDDIGLPLANEAHDLGNTATVVTVGALVAGAAGAVLLLTAPKGQAKASTGYWVGPGRGGLAITF